MHVAPSHYTHMLWRSCWEHIGWQSQPAGFQIIELVFVARSSSNLLGPISSPYGTMCPYGNGLFRLHGVLWQLRCCPELLVRTCPGRAAHRSVPRQLWDLSPNRNPHVSLHPIAGRQDTPVEGGREGGYPPILVSGVKYHSCFLATLKARPGTLKWHKKSTQVFDLAVWYCIYKKK